MNQKASWFLRTRMLKERGVRYLAQMASVLLIIFIFAPPTISASSYAVRGRVTFRVLEENLTKGYSFNAVVDGCRWLISTTNDVFEAFDFKEAAFDGQQLYFLA